MCTSIPCVQRYCTTSFRPLDAAQCKQVPPYYHDMIQISVLQPQPTLKPHRSHSCQLGFRILPISIAPHPNAHLKPLSNELIFQIYQVCLKELRVPQELVRLLNDRKRLHNAGVFVDPIIEA